MVTTVDSPLVQKPSGRAAPWQPGYAPVSPGRPRTAGLTEALRDLLDKPSETKGLTWRQALAIATLKLAMKGNAKALEVAYDRLEGKVKVDVDINTTADLWARLNEGRLRLSARETTTERVIQADGVTQERTITREVTFDPPALEPAKDAAFAWGEDEY